MDRMIYGESVQGAYHIRACKPCQDSYRFINISDDVTVMAVADGHGSDSCTFSKTGSRIAINVFCYVMENLFKNYEGNTELLMTYLNREGEVKIAQAIDEEWKRRVWKAHLDNKREKPLDKDGGVDKTAVYRLYGTTLLGLLITSEFLFAFQMGDGDILYIDSNHVEPIIEADKLLGTETHSLSTKNAWKKVITIMRRHDIEDGIPKLYLMSTDGFANSYPTTDAFMKTCQDYYAMIQEYGFKAVCDNLQDWLNEVSTLGCGDDITVLLLYYS